MLHLPQTDEEIRKSVIFIRDNHRDTYDRVKQALYSHDLNLSPDKICDYVDIYLFIKHCLSDAN